MQGFKFYPIIAMLFIASEIIGLTLGPRLINEFGLLLPGGILFFPLTYFFIDVVAEVYGYKQTRHLIWSNIFTQIFYGLMVYVSLAIPSAKIIENPENYNLVLGHIPHMVVASILATSSSYFINAILLARLKILTKGRYFGLRSISSTAIAEAAFSIIWVIVFFHGKLPAEDQVWLILSQYFLKVGYEVCATPLTYLAAGFLKKKEGIDIYDYRTRFSIFSLELNKKNDS